MVRGESVAHGNNTRQICTKIKPSSVADAVYGVGCFKERCLALLCLNLVPFHASSRCAFHERRGPYKLHFPANHR